MIKTRKGLYIKLAYISLASLFALTGCSAIHSNPKVIGSVDIKCDANSSSGDDIEFTDDMDVEERASLVMSWLLGREINGVKLEKHHVAGIIGNLFAESGVSPTRIERQPFDLYPIVIPDGQEPPPMTTGVGFGLAQWTDVGRQSGLKEFSQSHGGKYWEVKTQLLYLVHELETNHKGSFDSLLQQKNVKDATNDFCTKFEKPKEKYAHRETRIEFAEKMLKSSPEGNNRSSMNCKKSQGYGDIAELAILLAWPLGTPDSQTGRGIIQSGKNCTPNGRCDICKEKSKPEHIQYREKAIEIGLIPKSRDTWAYADCARFTELVVQVAADKDFQAGTADIKEYMGDTKGVPGKWEYIDAKGPEDLEPGDVYNINEGGHLGERPPDARAHSAIYVGEVDGEEHLIAESSFCEWGAVLNHFRPDLIGGNSRWYRFVGTPDKTDLF